MKKFKLGVIVAVAVIIGITFWTFDSVRQRSYEGSDISFMVGSGSVRVTNTSESAVPVTMRAEGRTSSFRVVSPELELTQSSAREGSGRNIFHTVHFDLTPGTSVISITRGSSVEFVSQSDTRIEATVTPFTAEGTQTRIIMALVVIVAALYYISNAFEHRWVGRVGSKLPRGSKQLDHSTT